MTRERYAGILNTVRHNILDASPLFTAAIGAAGAVVFTRSVEDAAAAAVIAVLVMTSTTVTSSLARMWGVGKNACFLVFFTTAATVVAACGLFTAHVLPLEWNRIGACCPLFTAGSLAAHVSRMRSDTLACDAAAAASCSAGYGISLILIALLRAAFGSDYAESPSCALILAGVIAAVYGGCVRRLNEYIKARAVKRAAVSAASAESLGIDDADDSENADVVEVVEIEAAENTAGACDGGGDTNDGND